MFACVLSIKPFVESVTFRTINAQQTFDRRYQEPELTKLFNSLISAKKRAHCYFCVNAEQKPAERELCETESCNSPECTASSRCRQTSTALCLAFNQLLSWCQTRKIKEINNKAFTQALVTSQVLKNIVKINTPQTLHAHTNTCTYVLLRTTTTIKHSVALNLKHHNQIRPTLTIAITATQFYSDT